MKPKHPRRDALVSPRARRGLALFLLLAALVASPGFVRLPRFGGLDTAGTAAHCAAMPTQCFLGWAKRHIGGAATSAFTLF